MRSALRRATGVDARLFALLVRHRSPIADRALSVGALAAGVAYSRVHTGVHYPGDVLAGAAAGTAAGMPPSRASRS